MLRDIAMPDTPQTSDLDSTIHLLQQDPKSIDLAVAIVLIERWESQLQGMDIFGSLSELKQGILSGKVTNSQKMLNELSQEVLAISASVREDSAEMAAKLEEISELLPQLANRLTRLETTG